MGRGNIFKLNEPQQADEQKQDKAFRLYCEAASPTNGDVAKQVGVDESTVSRWAAKSEWRRKREELRASAVAEFVNRNGSLRERTEENLLIADQLKKVLEQRIKAKKEIVSGRELAELTRVLEQVQKLESRMYADFGIKPAL